MGTGSSKARRWTPARRWRATQRGSGSSSAPAGQGQAEEDEEEEEEEEGPAAPAGARGHSRQALSPATGPAEPEPDSDAELLDQVLAECRAGGGGGGGDHHEPRLLRLPGRSPRLDAGDSRPRPAGGGGGEGGIRRDPQVFLPRSTAESSKFDNEHPLKKPERQAKIAYDYSEEELMATIEQEYCR